MTERPTDDALLAAPKVLLHDHLDGGVRPATVMELAREQGYANLPTTDVDDLPAWFHRGAKRNDLVLYLETFAHTVGVMQDRDAITRVAAECAAGPGRRRRRLRRGALRPRAPHRARPHPRRGGRGGARGLPARRRRHQPHASTRSCRPCAPRRAAWRSPRLAVRWRDAGVVGFDIAGAEAGYPPTRHLDAFQYVAAGELPHHHPRRRGVRAAVDLGGDAVVRRRAPRATACASSTTSPSTGGRYELGRLAAFVRDRRIPLEMCPTSNVNTGAAPSIAEHPIGLLRRLRFRVTVNTDNRLMSATSMTNEIRQLRDAFGYGWDDFEWLTVNAMKSAFAPFDERLRIINERIKPRYAMLRAAGMGISALA